MLVITTTDRWFKALADLEGERATCEPRWIAYYDKKIAEMREAIYGSGAEGKSGVQHVPGGDAPTVREDGSSDGTV